MGTTLEATRLPWLMVAAAVAALRGVGGEER